MEHHSSERINQRIFWQRGANVPSERDRRRRTNHGCSTAGVQILKKGNGNNNTYATHPHWKEGNQSNTSMADAKHSDPRSPIKQRRRRRSKILDWRAHEASKGDIWEERKARRPSLQAAGGPASPRTGRGKAEILQRRKRTMEAVKQTKKGLMRVEVLLYNFKASCSHPRKFKFNNKKKQPANWPGRSKPGGNLCRDRKYYTCSDSTHMLTLHTY